MKFLNVGVGSVCLQPWGSSFQSLKAKEKWGSSGHTHFTWVNKASCSCLQILFWQTNTGRCEKIESQILTEMSSWWVPRAIYSVLPLFPSPPTCNSTLCAVHSHAPPAHGASSSLTLCLNVIRLSGSSGFAFFLPVNAFLCHSHEAGWTGVEEVRHRDVNKYVMLRVPPGWSNLCVTLMRYFLSHDPRSDLDDWLSK